ncbi:TetR family transcriptional regulator [Kitasatospora sp. NPDC052896]|uniref:TetR family transcriptional regulator n=1 Tax=Kitasatospora sp. NPDC052896 TaxID=3364061 RepID=UPI0037C950AB
MVKQARSRHTHEQILDAAAAEFARYGYPVANLQRVADRIGLTKGALYGHFGSKEQLAEALVGRLDELLEPPGPPGAPPIAELRSLTCALAERIEADVRTNAALRLVVDEAQAASEEPKFLVEVHKRALDLLSREGLDATCPPGPVADLAVAVLVGAYYTAPAADRRGLADRVRGMWDVLTPSVDRRP